MLEKVQQHPENGALERRFWSQVDRSAGPDGCWPWISKARHVWGYGCISVNGQMIGAHRVAWELAHGPIPDGLWVLHHCDNPPCCNPGPRHLFLGTTQDNSKDRVEKGRSFPNQNTGIANCKRGHEFTPQNTYITTQGSRSCRICMRQHVKNYTHRKKCQAI